MKKTLSLNEKISTQVREWALSSTSHAIPHIYKSKNSFIRYTWLLFCLVSFGYCAYAIVQIVFAYLQYKTVLSMSIVQEIPAPFPAVTFCSLNAYNEEYAMSYLYLFSSAIDRPECLDYLKFDRECEKTNFEDYTWCYDNYVKLYTCFYPESYNIYQIKSFIQNYVTDDVIKKEYLGYNLYSDLLLGCSYNREICSSQDFTRFWSAEYGNCYTFNGNSKQVLESVQKGFNTGLMLEISLKNKMGDLNEFSDERGVYLVVHNQSTLPFTLTNGIILSPGFATNIGIERIVNSKLPEPYSDCIDELQTDKPYTQRLFEFFEELNITYYDQDVCFNICQQDKLIDKCNCSDINTATIRGVKYCMTIEEIYYCMYPFYADELSNQFKEHCIAACPQKCNTIEYKLHTNQAYYATLAKMNYLTQTQEKFMNLSYDEATLVRFGEQSIIRLNINYEYTYYTVIEQAPTVTVEKLLSNIGGVLGLFIGISFISLIEIFQLAYEIARLFLQHKREKAKLMLTTEDQSTNRGKF